MGYTHLWLIFSVALEQYIMCQRYRHWANPGNKSGQHRYCLYCCNGFQLQKMMRDDEKSQLRHEKLVLPPLLPPVQQVNHTGIHSQGWY